MSPTSSAVYGGYTKNRLLNNGTGHTVMRHNGAAARASQLSIGG
jgi:hypothetical protein